MEGVTVLRSKRSLLLIIVAVAGVVILLMTQTKKGIDFVISKWADAIQQHEGWFAGSRSYRNNNPGNLKIAGDLGKDSDGFGKFSSYTLGRNALESDLRAKISKYPNYTISQIMERYAPSSENNSALYAQVVARALGVPVSTTLSQLVGA